MKRKDFLFNNSRYRLLIVSILVIAIGFLLMSGGASNDPEVFSDAIYQGMLISLEGLKKVLTNKD